MGSTGTTEGLESLARRLWPNDARKQQQWLEAVSKLRRTRDGWTLDMRVIRVEKPTQQENVWQLPRR